MSWRSLLLYIDIFITLDISDLNLVCLILILRDIRCKPVSEIYSGVIPGPGFPSNELN
jgi:hypothetical protein